MPFFQHPFASTEFARRSHSTETLVRWLRQDRENEPVPPVPALPSSPVAPRAVVEAAPPAALRPASAPPPIDIDVPVRSSKSSPGHFVKHSSKVTVLLSGQEHKEKIPEYSNGGIIDGIIAVTRPSSLLALQILVEGVIRLSEIAGSGSVQVDILRDLLFTWNAEHNAPLPTKVTFRYSLPTHYEDKTAGERYRLPPTYDARLNAIPGFRAEVSYAVVVYVSRNRERMDWWRKNARMRIPFRFIERTRPSQPGPFPVNPKARPDMPKTLFSWVMASELGVRYNMKVMLYLPESQVCSLRTPMPFHVTLSGDEDTLTPFAGYRPLPESFHPISPSDTASVSLPQQLIVRAIQPTSPLDIGIYRRTDVETLRTTEGKSPKAHMHTKKLIAKGTVQSTFIQAGSITWSGVIIVPPRTRCSDFCASGIKVTDYLSCRIIPPDASRSDLIECSESIPMRLTTDSHDCVSAAVTISSDWSG